MGSDPGHRPLRAGEGHAVHRACRIAGYEHSRDRALLKRVRLDHRAKQPLLQFAAELLRQGAGERDARLKEQAGKGQLPPVLERDGLELSLCSEQPG